MSLGGVVSIGKVAYVVHIDGMRIKFHTCCIDVPLFMYVSFSFS
jgi:hypothetical protein